MPKTIAKVSKRKPDENDDRPSKKVAVTLGDMPPKKKLPLKSSRGTGRGVVTSSSLVIEGPRCHRGSFVKLMDIAPCDQLGTKDLGASTLFDLSRVCLLPQVKFVPSLSGSFD